MTDILILADASKVSGADFLDAIAPLLGKPTRADRQKQAEIAEALSKHRAAMKQTWVIPKLWDQITAREALKVEYQVRVREIERRYDERPTETVGDPLLKRRVA